MNRADRTDRIAGSLYGLLVGDARAVDGDLALHGGDGQQALCLLDAVLDDPHQIALSFRRRIVELYRTGSDEGGRLGLYRGSGANFRDSLMELVEGAAPEEAARGSAGDGAAVRIAPVALSLRQASDGELAEAVIAAALCTHRDPRSIAAAGAIAWLVRMGMTWDQRARDLVDEELVAFARLVERAAQERADLPVSVQPFAEALRALIGQVDEPMPALSQAVLSRAQETTDQPLEPGAPYALVSPLLAIAVFAKSRDFESAIDGARGSGAASAGALVGQLAGSLYGRGGIPLRWLDALRARGTLEDRIRAVDQGEQGFTPGFSLYELERGWTALVDEEAAYPPERRLPAEMSTEDPFDDTAGDDDFAGSVNETMKIDLSEVRAELDAGYEGSLTETLDLDKDDVARTLALHAAGIEDTPSSEPASAEPASAGPVAEDHANDQPANDNVADDEPVAGVSALPDGASAEVAHPGVTPTEGLQPPVGVAARGSPSAQLGLFGGAPAPQPAAPSAVQQAPEATPSTKKAPPPLTVPADVPATLFLVRGDITRQSVDAIVNAANTSLLGGGGVDGAIHRGGGPSILAECQRIRAAQGGCRTGAAVITGAGDLDASWVIHAVGPRWRGGEHDEAALLRSAYLRSLALAAEQGARRVAFPAISTGVYRYPLEDAARVALSALCEGMAAHPAAFDEVQMVVFDEASSAAFERVWAAHGLSLRVVPD